MRNSGQALLGVELQPVGGKASHVRPCLFPEAGLAGSFSGVSEGRGGSGGGGGWPAHHFGDAGRREHEQDPGFAPDTSEAAIGCLVFLASCCPQFALTVRAWSYF